jgi:hypothetical protein
LYERSLAVKLNVQIQAARVLNPVQLYLEVSKLLRVLTLKGVSDPLRGELKGLRVLHV